MQICCTRALLDELAKSGVSTTSSNPVDIERLFSWSAHLITLKRRKVAVVVNDSSRFGFVLFGLKSKDFANIKELLSQGIVSSLQDEGVKQEVIDRYTERLSDVYFTKTKERSAVARLNKACEIVKNFDDRIDSNTMYQLKLAKIMNNDFFKPSKQSDYIHPYEKVVEDLEHWYGSGIVQRRAVDILVQLDLDVYKATRRLHVPLPATFYDLHRMLQIAYDWKGYQLYCFMIFNSEGKQVAYIVKRDEFEGDYLSDCATYFDEEVMLETYMKADYSIQYCYDFGDDWLHEITVRGFNDNYEKNYTTCIMAEGNAPPEDVGGVGGYIEYLKIVSNPDHPEYKSMKRWAEGQWYRPFDIELVNHRLRYSK